MKGFLEFSQEWRPALEEAIRKHIDQLCDEVLRDDPRMEVAWQELLRKKLMDYACGGKMIRGLFAVYWAQLYGCEIATHKALFSVGASLELLQMFLLIHDDIMDGDEMRRAMPSMHVQLENAARTHAPSGSAVSAQFHGEHNFARMGESLAICLGDIVFSHALGIISAAIPASHAGRALHVFTTYVSRVGLAQMNDMYWESRATPPSKEAILAMYEGKTGHYTFTLPALMGYFYSLGAHAKVVDEREMNNLTCVGGLMGQLFQICDDVLDIRYPASMTGKPRGSDFMKKKRTFFQWKLLRCAAQHGKGAELEALCNGDIGAYEIEKVCRYAEEWSVYDEIQKECKLLVSEIEACVAELAINQEAKKHMRVFVQYLLERKA